MVGEPPSENRQAPPVAARRETLPRPILHANEGTIAAGHAGSIRRRSTAVALVAISLGMGATVYGVVAERRNCEPDPGIPNQAASCGQSASHASYFSSSYSDGRSAAATSGHSAATTSVSRGGFGAHGAMHASAGA